MMMLIQKSYINIELVPLDRFRYTKLTIDTQIFCSLSDSFYCILFIVMKLFSFNIQNNDSGN